MQGRGRPSPDSHAGDDLGATDGRQHGQEALTVPLGEIARGGLPVSFVGDLNGVQPKGRGLVLHPAEPEGEKIKSVKETLTSWNQSIKK